MSKGLLIVVSGFSGAGKGTIVGRLLSSYANYVLSISATTREPRQGEVHGRDYFFLSKEEFEARIEAKSFIEYANFVGNYYGTPKDYVIERLEAGFDVILEIDVQGAKLVKESFPTAFLVFVTPPSAMELRNRLINRGTETEEQINKRLKQALFEAEKIVDYDSILVNDDLDEAVCGLHALIQAEKSRLCYNLDFIKYLNKDLQSIQD